MYLWYSCSKICIAYLGDIPGRKLEDSEWFDRGWTLQELIAPKEVAFFDRDWNALGTKAGLLKELSLKTRIPEAILSHASKPSTCSVAQRFSWAATRITKRVEDRAYSLMGLFGIHMSMIYGERENAFIRLQQNIMQKSKDESLFAWAMDPTLGASMTYSGLYAPSPSVYIDCSEVVQLPGSEGFSESNGELSIQLELYPHGPSTYYAFLHCLSKAASSSRIYIILARIKDVDGYVRVRNSKGESLGQTNPRGYYIIKSRIRVPVDPQERPEIIFSGFWLRTLRLPGHLQSDISILSRRHTSDPKIISQHSVLDGNCGLVRIESKDNSEELEGSKVRWILFGFAGRDFRPSVTFIGNYQDPKLIKLFERAHASRQAGMQEADSIHGELFQMLRFYAPRRLVDISLDSGDMRVGFKRFVIPKLSLEIFIYLRRNDNPSMPLSRRTTDGCLLLDPTMVWVVDIVEVTSQPRGFFEAGLQMLKGIY